MVAAIGGASSYSQPEYLKVLQELMALGISSSGNLASDKVKLQQAKTELIQKIQDKQNNEQLHQVQPILPVEQIQDTQRAELEVQRLGAMNVAELNRLYFGI